jgi:hypothetical protein
MMSVLPGPIRQIGYVVTDLDSALANWIERGVGPWLVIRGLPMRALYRGEPCETTLSLAPNSPATVVEISELTDAQSASATFIRDAAAGWDGSDQIREMG